MDKITIVFVTNVGLMIGKPVFDSFFVLSSLKDPRIIVINQKENKIKMVSLIGNPEIFKINTNTSSYYEVEDQSIINQYVEKVSNITMATTIPSGPTLVK